MNSEGYFASENLEDGTGSCTVRFYYYMYGKDVGTLKVQSKGVVGGEIQIETVGQVVHNNEKGKQG